MSEYTPPLEGMVPEQHKKLDRLAHTFAIAKAKAKEASKAMKDAGAELAQEMHSLKLPVYEFGGVRVELSMLAKVKVHVRESEDGGDEEEA